MTTTVWRGLGEVQERFGRGSGEVQERFGRGLVLRETSVLTKSFGTERKKKLRY